MRNSFSCLDTYRINPVTIEQIMDDFGASCGDYEKGKEAFDRFKAVVEKNIRFLVNEKNYDIPLIIVEVEGIRILDD